MKKTPPDQTLREGLPDASVMGQEQACHEINQDPDYLALTGMSAASISKKLNKQCTDVDQSFAVVHGMIKGQVSILSKASQRIPSQNTVKRPNFMYLSRVAVWAMAFIALVGILEYYSPSNAPRTNAPLQAAVVSQELEDMAYQREELIASIQQQAKQIAEIEQEMQSLQRSVREQTQQLAVAKLHKGEQLLGVINAPEHTSTGFWSYYQQLKQWLFAHNKVEGVVQ